jgi:quercetin dioxygenase-like cupin family protein
VIVTRQHASLPAPARVIDGAARYEALAAPSAPSRVEVLHVHFSAGSRTQWHTHLVGQLLIVTSGTGWARNTTTEAGPVSWNRPPPTTTRRNRSVS